MRNQRFRDERKRRRCPITEGHLSEDGRRRPRREFTLPILGGYEGSSLNFTFPILTTNAGGFLVLGVALAIIAAIENHKKSVAAAKAKAEKEAAALAKGAN